MEHQAVESEVFAVEDVVLRVAMNSVADNRMAEVRQVAAKLMCPSCTGFQQQDTVAGGLISSDGMRKFYAGALTVVCDGVELLGLRSIPEGIVDSPFGHLHPAANDGDIEFADATFDERGVEGSRGVDMKSEEKGS